MKRILFISIFLFLFHAIDVQAANWYVRPSGGSGSGTSWTASWNGFDAINWGSVSCGDTIWVAGGTYGGWMQPMKACTSGAPLAIRRARSDASACTSASGWSSGYDSTVIQDNGVIAFNPGTNNYITISGRTTATGGGYGWKIYNHTTSGDNYGIMVWTSASVNHLTVEYMEIEGPSRQFDAGGAWGSRGIGDSPYLGSSSYHTFSHMKIHGFCTGIYLHFSNNHIVEYVDMYDIGANGGTDHPNLIYIGDSANGIVRYSKFHDSAASGTGVVFSDGGSFANWQIYGNLFYDMNTLSASAIGVQTGGSFGGGPITGLKIYNNTFSNNVMNINMSGSTCGTGCETKNNIFHGSVGAIGCGTTSNNLTTSDSSIFVNSAAKDFHIVSTTGSGYPRNAGTSLSSYFTTEMDGTTFGGDGTWDIGAYAYNTGGGGGSIKKVSAPMNLHFN